MLIEILNRNVDLLEDHSQALTAGESIDDADPYSIASLSKQVSNLKWIVTGAIGGSFVYLYATLVYMVWEGWRTITSQRIMLESANAELETRVADRVEELQQTLEEGQRRLDAFRTAAGRLALEEVPETALEHLVDVARDLVGARHAVLALLDPVGSSGKFVTSGLDEKQLSRLGRPPRKLAALGLDANGGDRLRIGDESLLMTAHGFSPERPAVGTFLGVPVALRGESSGAFYVMEKEGGLGFSEDDQRLVDLFAVLASVYLENVNLYDDIAREERTLAAIQASMTEGLVVLDPQGKVMYLNETARPLWTLRPEDVQGKHVSEVFNQKAADFDSEDGLKALLDLALDSTESGSTVALTLANPQRRHLEVTTFHIPAGQDQNMTGLLARDVTQEKELQDRRDTFVSIASHELRTPMTTIMGFSELLLTNEDAPASARHDWLERIHQNSQILSAIVDDMLNLSRIQSGKLAINLEYLPVGNVVEEVLSDIRSDDGDSHDFHVSVPEDTPAIVADREKLTQILINLVTNAVKYSPKGGAVTISARHEPAQERVVVQVADEGIGISPDDQEQLFNSFHRIRRPETEGVRGTGLGLSIVKGLVALMRGEVWVESELNQGSTFFFTMPTNGTEVDSSGDRDTLAAV